MPSKFEPVLILSGQLVLKHGLRMKRTQIDKPLLFDSRIGSADRYLPQYSTTRPSLEESLEQESCQLCRARTRVLECRDSWP